MRNLPSEKQSLRNRAIIAKIVQMAHLLSAMKSMSAKNAKNSFGLLLDTARAEPVTIEKHGRAVVVVLSVEAYQHLLKRRVKAVREAGNTPARKKERA
jgi:prevent-host-death family protein